MKLSFNQTILPKGIMYYAVTNNKGIQLGTIGYHKHWKEHVWEQEAQVIMSEKCLQQVYSFIVQLNLKYNCSTK